MVCIILQQTSIKYEDKLTEMCEQHKHREIELRKNPNDSTRRPEVKCAESVKEQQEKMFDLQNRHHVRKKKKFFFFSCNNNRYNICARIVLSISVI